MAQDNGGLPPGPRVAIGRMGGHLLVPGVDELDRTFFEFGEDGDVGMPAEAEYMFDASILEVLDQLPGNQLFHGCLTSLVEGDYSTNWNRIPSWNCIPLLLEWKPHGEWSNEQ